jgi:cyclopropane-fatty-acyl-phospholipid synthase
MPGSHYQKTAEAWLANMDQHRHEIRAVFTNTYGKKTGAHLAATLAHFFYGLCRVVWL